MLATPDDDDYNYVGHTESHEQPFFACNLKTAEERE
jgi:hypothetical protein